jgi:prevent-host-death family protein
MKEWKLAEAQRCLGEVVRRAKVCGPQGITGRDGTAVVLSAADYKRLIAESGLAEADFSEDDDAPAGEPMSFLEFMQTSPLAEAIRAGEIDLERYPDWPRGL